MLTLNNITLFFHHRSPVDKTHVGLIDKWVADVNSTVQSPGQSPARSLRSVETSSASPRFKHVKSNLSISSQPTAVTDYTEDKDKNLATARTHKSSLSVRCPRVCYRPCLFSVAQVGVKIESITPGLGSDSSHQGRIYYTNRDLPQGAKERNIWRRVFIPTYAIFVANYPDPWTIKDTDAVVALQHVWDAVYVDGQNAAGIPFKVAFHDCVFSIVSFSTCLFALLIFWI